MDVGMAVRQTKEGIGGFVDSVVDTFSVLLGRPLIEEDQATDLGALSPNLHGGNGTLAWNNRDAFQSYVKGNPYFVAAKFVNDSPESERPPSESESDSSMSDASTLLITSSVAIRGSRASRVSFTAEPPEVRAVEYDSASHHPRSYDESKTASCPYGCTRTQRRTPTPAAASALLLSAQRATGGAFKASAGDYGRDLRDGGASRYASTGLNFFPSQPGVRETACTICLPHTRLSPEEAQAQAQTKAEAQAALRAQFAFSPGNVLAAKANTLCLPKPRASSPPGDRPSQADLADDRPSTSAEAKAETSIATPAGRGKLITLGPLSFMWGEQEEAAGRPSPPLQVPEDQDEAQAALHMLLARGTAGACRTPMISLLGVTPPLDAVRRAKLWKQQQDGKQQAGKQQQDAISYRL